MRAARFVLAACLALSMQGAYAAEPQQGCSTATLTPAHAGRALSGNTIALSDGRRVRLAGVMVPPSPALAEAAQERLQMIAGGRPILLGDPGAVPDRHGRIVARVFLDDGHRWVEDELLRSGLLRVFTLRDDRACAGALLAAEAAARAVKAGLWADPEFAIRQADDSSLSEAGGRYQIVEGEVLSTGRTAAAAYLNFGGNWSTDFTVTVNMTDAKWLESEGLEIDALAGRRVRVRGWLSVEDGPAMRVDHPEQIEMLSR